MKNDSLKKRWNRLASLYDFILANEEQAYSEVKRQIIKTIDYDDKVLELAAGTGNIALELCPHCRHVEASDISEEMIRIALENKAHSKYQNIQFSVSDACNIQSKDSTYDVIILSNALHVLPNPDEAMAEIKRVLKPGGRLIAPNFMHDENLKSYLFSSLLTTVGFKTKRKFTEQKYHDYISSHENK
eukprot:gnl/Carplike_NY0171/3260_a4387_494.p1 GENE.gnl/Carplike_NY0171/3260_a4387_494~~gnl/Carplike_NY0171/3260_a4387_494.p1  ORF type:complete len:187 (-),score=8.39 gnl/Carplike_NY0171/3260_a4387_494:11-571(-)